MTALLLMTEHNTTFLIVGILAGAASAITILRYVTRWIKTKILQALNLAQTWRQLVNAVNELKDLMTEIFKLLQNGHETMEAQDKRLTIIEHDMLDVKRDVRFLLERKTLEPKDD